VGEGGEAPALMGVAGTNFTPHTDGSHVDEAEPQLDDVPGQATLAPGSSKAHGFSLSREPVSDDVTSVPGSFDIVECLSTTSYLVFACPPPTT
jgi:hypothetical protein